MRRADRPKSSADTRAGPTEQGATRTKTLQPMVRPTWLVRKQANLPRLRT